MSKLPFADRTSADRTFADRTQAGKLLAAELAGRDLVGNKAGGNVTVLALPRGGVVVGFEIAKVLDAPLDVVVVRKLGVPRQPELAMGAIAGHSIQVLSEELIADLHISQREVGEAIARERIELDRREKLYRSGRPALKLQGQTVVLVDDGLATGSTMLVAARYVRALAPAKTIIAVPVASTEACELLKPEADELVCLATPQFFMAVGEWFADFRQVEDAEVRRLLQENQRESSHRVPVTT